MTANHQKEIYIIRHGQTDYNLKGIVQGRGINASLNENGRKQAEAFFRKYGKNGFDIIYTSSLKRTQETVSSFVRNGIIHEIRPDIDEISWGIYEGLKSSPVLKQDYYKIVDSWLEGKISNKIDGGESPLDLQNRLKPFIEELKTREFKRALVCTHGRTIRVLLCTMLEEELTRMDKFDHENLALYRLKCMDSGKFQIELRNCTKHLELY